MNVVRISNFKVSERVNIVFKDIVIVFLITDFLLGNVLVDVLYEKITQNFH